MNTSDSAAKKGNTKITSSSTITTPTRLRNLKGQFIKTPQSQTAAAADPPTAPLKTARSKKVAVNSEAEASDDDDEGPEALLTPSKKKATKLSVKAIKASTSQVKRRVPRKVGGHAPPLRDARGRFMKGPSKVGKSAGGDILETPRKKGKSFKKVTKGTEEVEESKEEGVVETPAKPGRSAKKVPVEISKKEKSNKEKVVKTPIKKDSPKKVQVEESEAESNGEQDVTKASGKQLKKVVKKKTTSAVEKVEEVSAEEGTLGKSTGKNVTDSESKKVVPHNQAAEVKKPTPLEVASDGEAEKKPDSASPYATPESMVGESQEVAENASPAIAPKTGTGRKRGQSPSFESGEISPRHKKARIGK